MSRKSEVLTELFDCPCGSVDHVMRVQAIDDEVFVSVVLSTSVGFWDRVRAALRYVFWSHDTSIGEALISGADAPRLKALLSTAERRARKVARKAEAEAPPSAE